MSDYDKQVLEVGSPAWIDRQRKKDSGVGGVHVIPHHGQWWCEGCMKYVPARLGKKSKGWTCGCGKVVPHDD